MKYYYQDILGKTVELSKSEYYRTRKAWSDITVVDIGYTGTGEKYRKLICVKLH